MTLAAVFAFVANIMQLVASPGGLDVFNRLFGENNLTPQAVLAELQAAEKPGDPTK